MLDRDTDRTIVFHCDGKRCAEVLETETTDFDGAREILADEDWQTRMINNEWLHVCPICQEQEVKGAL